jgi:hypothetical protein
MHLAVVTDYGKISMFRLDGERLGERVAEHDVDRHPRVTWSASGRVLTFVDGRSGVASRGRAESSRYLRLKELLLAFHIQLRSIA